MTEMTNPKASCHYRVTDAVRSLSTDEPEIVIGGAGHFLQEEKGEELAAHIVSFIERTPVK
jgi:pimeloyl-ACP methyl ester carboxylesterase